MLSGIKRLTGKALLQFCEQCPAGKPFLKQWGLRANHQWFVNHPVHVQLADGKSFQLASLGENYLTFQLFWKGTDYYEPITTALAKELVKDGGTFIDIGANIGFYSLVLSTCRPGLKVLAFEPNPKNFRLLEQNVHLNGLESAIQCEPLALSDADGPAVLHLSESDMSASLESDFQPTGKTARIEATRLDTYLANHPVSGPLLIKVDVEGHEAAFFKGAESTLANLHPDVISEVTRPQEHSVTEFLTRAGYRFYQITDRGLLRSDELRLVVRDRFVFLNYLLSARPEREVAELYSRIEPRIRKLDLTQTSKYVEPAAIRELQAQQTLHQAPV